MELYKLSGRVSGGVCVDCRHDTTGNNYIIKILECRKRVMVSFVSGRHCHYCREGFYRDPSKPLQHKKACKRKYMLKSSSSFKNSCIHLVEERKKEIKVNIKALQYEILVQWPGKRLPAECVVKPMLLLAHPHQHVYSHHLRPKCVYPTRWIKVPITYPPCLNRWEKVNMK